MKRSVRHSDEWMDLLASTEGAESGRELIDFVGRLQQVDDRHEGHAAFVAKLAAEAAASAASTPDGSGSPQPLTDRWRRRAMIKTFLSTMLGKLVMGGATVALATGGMAATGTLPDNAQRTAANAAARIGLELPSPGDPALEQSMERTRTESSSSEASGTQTQSRIRTEEGSGEASSTQTRTKTRERVESNQAEGSQTQTRSETQDQSQGETQDPASTKTQSQTSSTKTQSQTRTEDSGSGDGGSGTSGR